MYIIVGAGPSGLALSYLLGRLGKRCIVIDRETEIGGCHRVLRVDGMFTEHAPRVYLTSYLNTHALLEKMGIRDTFVGYQFSILQTIVYLFQKFSIREILYLVLSFVLYVIKPFGEKISVADWCCHFSASSLETLDRFCRFTDGAGSERYSIQKLFQLQNQNLFYQVLQPRLPNDVGLFPQMRLACEQTGYVSFLLGHTVERIISINGKIRGVVTNGETLPCDNVVLCVPPPSLYAILDASNLISSFPRVGDLVEKSTYDTYLSATFHYSSELTIKSKWGFPVGEWGVVTNRITDYMNLNDPRSRTVFSLTCMYLNRVSHRLHKTVQELSDSSMILEEMYQQVKEVYTDLPRPDYMILSPTAHYTGSEWKERDSAFIATVEGVTLDSDAEGVVGLYQVGTQNGKSSFSYTTMESAVTNAIEWYNKKFPEEKVVVQNPVPFRRMVWLIIIAVISYFVLKKYRQRK